MNLKDLKVASRAQDEQFARRHEERSAPANRELHFVEAREELRKPAGSTERWDQTCAVPANNKIAQMPVVRTFDTGANRDVDHDKLDYEGFLSPLVIERFGSYMHKNRFLRDDSIRASDNWQKGIPLPVYMKSMWRHFLAVWKHHRALMKLQAQEKVDPADIWQLQAQMEEDLSALFFNVQGYLHELLKR